MNFENSVYISYCLPKKINVLVFIAIHSIVNTSIDGLNFLPSTTDCFKK